MTPTRPDCPGSFRPMRNRKVGDWAMCDACKRLVHLISPPGESTHDPWRGSIDARVPPHEMPKRGKE